MARLMGRRQFYLWSVLGGVLAVLGLATFLPAASLDLTELKEMTHKLTEKNVAALMGVSTAVPEEFHLEVVEAIHAVESSHERIILVFDRIEQGLFPSEEGMGRARTIAKRSAEREKEFLQALMDRVPAPSVPKLTRALTVSAESWKDMMSAFHLPPEPDEPDLPQRPGFNIQMTPGLPTSPPPDE